MMHHPTDTVTDADIEDLADAVGVLRRIAPSYRVPTNLCALCGMPTGGVLCTDCATK